MLNMLKLFNHLLDVIGHLDVAAVSDRGLRYGDLSDRLLPDVMADEDDQSLNTA
jgi:hypothetical protein